MLNKMSPSSRQGGVVLMIALIILVALTLGGIALIRSVDTTNLISGNLAFQQAATRSGEAGTETAMQAFLEAVTTTQTSLWNDNFARAYAASTPAVGTTASWWDTYWSTTINPNDQVLPGQCSDGTAGGGRVCVLPADATGNIVSYTIQRLCQSAGDPTQATTTGCARGSQPLSTRGEDFTSDSSGHLRATQYFYRITTRVAGPRNTSSYIQTVVAR
jgi:type IV pilus assembly protein PilX